MRRIPVLHFTAARLGALARAAALGAVGLAAPLAGRADERTPIAPAEPALAPALAPAPAPPPAPAEPPALPRSVDLRAALERLGLGPRRQGARGTCSVFTMAGAIEAAVARAEGRGIRLSVEYLNWAANEACGHHSDGQFFHAAWKGYERFGVAEESAMPYRERFDADRVPSAEARASAEALARHRLRLHWIKPNDGKKGVTEAELAAARAVLARGIPVAAGSYHSVLFVGYEDDAGSPGGGFFRVFDSGSGRDGTMSYEEALGRLCDMGWVGAAEEAP